MDKKNQSETLSRMKALMGYGLKTEGKEAPYSNIEYQKRGADGKVYSILREGTSYFIKVADYKPTLMKEDFQYIGGFRNRKDNQYSSYADAQKNFDLKMMSLKEANDKKDFIVESWNIDKHGELTVEATEKMRKEIMRQRQIMKNASLIQEKKEIDTKIAASQDDNIKKDEPKCGNAADACDGIGFKKADCCKDSIICDDKKTEDLKEAEVLAWNRNGDTKTDNYMDKSHGTEIGSSMPFDDAKGKQIDGSGDDNPKTSNAESGVIGEETAMHNADNQNTPSVGVGEGPSDRHNKPFDDEMGKQIDEAIDDFEADEADDSLGDGIGDETDDIDAGIDDADAAMADDAMADADAEMADDELATDDAIEDDVEATDDIAALESRISSIEGLLRSIANELGVNEPAVDEEPYQEDGEDIFDGDEDDTEYEVVADDEEEPIDDQYNAECGMMPESRQRVRVIESPRYKKLMREEEQDAPTSFKDAGRVPQGNMNKLDDFGKHPAYQKKVMELPPKDMQEFPRKL